jgi:hypothetical protein
MARVNTTFFSIGALKKKYTGVIASDVGSEAISLFGKRKRLLRRFAPRNDTCFTFSTLRNKKTLAFGANMPLGVSYHSKNVYRGAE